MPNFNLSRQEIDDILAYLEELNGRLAFWPSPFQPELDILRHKM
jgi:hypothetical protein